MNQSEKRQYWTSIIEKQTVSGLSIPAFCKANDLSYPTFHYWLKKLTEQNGESQHAHSIVINDDIGTDTVALHFPNGIKAELPAALFISSRALQICASLSMASQSLSLMYWKWIRSVKPGLSSGLLQKIQPRLRIPPFPSNLATQ